MRRGMYVVNTPPAVTPSTLEKRNKKKEKEKVPTYTVASSLLPIDEYMSTYIKAKATNGLFQSSLPYLAKSKKAAEIDTPTIPYHTLPRWWLG